MRKLAIIVDDMEECRKVAALYLKRAGFDVKEFEDGAAAFAELQNMRFDGRTPSILVTDLEMPLIDGRELARLVREIFPRIRVVLMSGRFGPEHVIDAELARTVDRILPKPFDKERFLEVVQFPDEPPEPMTIMSRYIVL